MRSRPKAHRCDLMGALVAALMALPADVIEALGRGTHLTVKHLGLAVADQLV